MAARLGSERLLLLRPRPPYWRTYKFAAGRPVGVVFRIREGRPALRGGINNKGCVNWIGMRALGLSLVLLTFASAFGARASRPHLIVLFADNLGWANVGYHRPEGVDLREYATPHIDALAAEGMQLDRHYTYKYCSPSRSSLLSGRLPVHVNIYNDDPAMPGQGVPVNMTLLPEQLGKAGYVSHFVGKWHVGMASRRSNPPEARGFSTSLGYFHSTNNYYNGLRAQGCADRPARDVWDTGAPAPPLDDCAPPPLASARRLVHSLRCVHRGARLVHPFRGLRRVRGARGRGRRGARLRAARGGAGAKARRGGAALPVLRLPLFLRRL